MRTQCLKDLAKKRLELKPADPAEQQKTRPAVRRFDRGRSSEAQGTGQGEGREVRREAAGAHEVCSYPAFVYTADHKEEAAQRYASTAAEEGLQLQR